MNYYKTMRTISLFPKIKKTCTILSNRETMTYLKYVRLESEYFWSLTIELAGHQNQEQNVIQVQ